MDYLDLDQTIMALLEKELPADLVNQVNINFATPDAQFPPLSITLPAINLFLYDIRENTELRQAENLRYKRTSTSTGKSTIRAEPLPITRAVDFSYFITAWSNNKDNAAEEEHAMLKHVISTLLRYTEIPEDFLQGELKDIRPLPRAELLRAPQLGSIGDLWSAMGGKLRPAIHYKLTTNMQVSSAITGVPAPVALTVTSKLKETSREDWQEKQHQIALIGLLQDSSNTPITEEKVTAIHKLTGEVTTTLSASDGYFYFVNLAEGDYIISVDENKGAGYGSKSADASITKDADGDLIIGDDVILTLPTL